MVSIEIIVWCKICVWILIVSSRLVPEGFVPYVSRFRTRKHFLGPWQVFSRRLNNCVTFGIWENRYFLFCATITACTRPNKIGAMPGETCVYSVDLFHPCCVILTFWFLSHKVHISLLSLLSLFRPLFVINLMYLKYSLLWWFF